MSGLGNVQDFLSFPLISMPLSSIQLWNYLHASSGNRDPFYHVAVGRTWARIEVKSCWQWKYHSLRNVSKTRDNQIHIGFVFLELQIFKCDYLFYILWALGKMIHPFVRYIVLLFVCLDSQTVSDSVILCASGKFQHAHDLQLDQ